MNVKPYPLEYEDAITHFLEVADADGQGLSSVMQAYLEGGRFFALAPSGVPHSRLKKFRSGCLLPPDAERTFLPRFEDVTGRRLVAVPVGDLADEMAKIICRSSKQYPTVTTFIREPYLRPSDRSERLSELVPVGRALYKPIALKECSPADLTNDIRNFQVSWSFLLILSAVDIHEGDLDAILANAILISVGAYDGESYLYWMPGTNRQSSPCFS